MQDNLLQTARRAATAGAQVISSLWDQRHEVEQKQSVDFVTDVDRLSQAAVLAEEEAGDYPPPEAKARVLWVVDPVAVSVAACLDGVLVTGVVRNVTRGGGAWLDGRRLKVSAQGDPAASLLLTGFPFRDKARLPRYLELFQELFMQVSGVRRAGAAALDLAYVTAGRGEGFWEMGLKPWDMAAGILLVEEAGGVVSDFDGKGQSLWRGDIVAASPALHGLMQGACARYFPGG